MGGRAILMIGLSAVCPVGFALAQEGNYRQGLAGTFFKGEDFTRPEDETHFLRSVDNAWVGSEGNNWSARWAGFIEGPYTGEVIFTAMAVDGIRLVVNGKAQLHLYWQWEGQSKSIVPAERLNYDPSRVGETSKEGMPGDDMELPQVEVPPAGPEHECVTKHVMVYDEPGRYAGWPANGGFWMWGDEMAVAFECGWFEDRPDWMDGHARDGSRGNEDIVARSSDGGLTWTHKKYDIMSSDEGIRDIPGGMDFGSPGFGFKCQGGRFYYTYDRGKNWSGPYRVRITGLAGADEGIESHTCYIINGKKDGYFFFGVEPEDAEDRFYCTRTTDGGETFEFLGWVSPPPEKAANYERWAVYSAVKVSEKHLVAALRRKINKRSGRVKRLNWIDVYESKDGGRTWSFLSKVADTDVPNSDFNGNPPSILKLRDGRLCVTYGFRAKPCVMCAKLSSDNGKTWCKPIILRTGARNWDFGYSRSLQRPDGKVVTVYYFATPDNRDQFITATLWDPERVGEKR